MDLAGLQSGIAHRHTLAGIAAITSPAKVVSRFFVLCHEYGGQDPS
jgi:hypothetical protein